MKERQLHSFAGARGFALFPFPALFRFALGSGARLSAFLGTGCVSDSTRAAGAGLQVVLFVQCRKPKKPVLLLGAACHCPQAFRDRYPFDEDAGLDCFSKHLEGVISVIRMLVVGRHVCESVFSPLC